MLRRMLGSHLCCLSRLLPLPAVKKPSSICYRTTRNPLFASRLSLPINVLILLYTATGPPCSSWRRLSGTRFQRRTVSRLYAASQRACRTFPDCTGTRAAHSALFVVCNQHFLLIAFHHHFSLSAFDAMCQARRRGVALAAMLVYNEPALFTTDIG